MMLQRKYFNFFPASPFVSFICPFVSFSKKGYALLFSLLPFPSFLSHRYHRNTQKRDKGTKGHKDTDGDYWLTDTTEIHRKRG